MEYTLTFSDNELSVLNQLLLDAPFRVAAPIIDKINKQIREQQNKSVSSHEEAKA